MHGSLMRAAPTDRRLAPRRVRAVGARCYAAGRQVPAAQPQTDSTGGGTVMGHLAPGIKVIPTDYTVHDPPGGRVNSR